MEAVQAARSKNEAKEVRRLEDEMKPAAVKRVVNTIKQRDKYMRDKWKLILNTQKLIEDLSSHAENNELVEAAKETVLTPMEKVGKHCYYM